VNHDLFWKSMSPWGGVPPAGDSSTIQERRLAAGIDRVFNSFEAMKHGFSAAASAVFGSGWTFLYYDKKLQSLEITNTTGHDTPAFEPHKVSADAL
jgi:superoxide dismutase, Fe-Mn family